jgi:hypothetical protein
VANDFPAFFAKYPNITHIYFNGRKPEMMFRRRALPFLPNTKHVLINLPSSSSAHARKLDVKVQAWSVMREVILKR